MANIENRTLKEEDSTEQDLAEGEDFRGIYAYLY